MRCDFTEWMPTIKAALRFAMHTRDIHEETMMRFAESGGNATLDPSTAIDMANDHRRASEEIRKVLDRLEDCEELFGILG